jgi:hypothetical protein
MRDKRFVAEHRCGPLTKEKHYLLMKWAFDCAQHVLPLFQGKMDPRLTNAFEVAERWRMDKASVGDVRNAVYGIIALARELPDPLAIFVARSVGQMVATAHMADHSLGAAWYALKAVKAAGKSVDAERKWQDEQLPPEIRGLVLSARSDRKFVLK